MASTVLNYLPQFQTFKWIGALVVILKILRLTDFFAKELYCRFVGFRWRKLGKWAVITGGTDGIGKAYAEELAVKGFNICLISRNIEKLDSVANELEQNYEVATKVINVDFTQGPEIYAQINNELKELDGDIGVLVNNVGMSYKYPEYFHEIPDGLKVMWDMINSNITSCTMMMRLVMPKMKSKGVIINISSLMAVYPMPLLTVYAACKAYVENLSKATQYEYKNKGFTIQCVLPAYVATKMSNRRTSLEIPSANTYVSSAIKTVGVENNTYGYLPHKIRGFTHEWLKATMPAHFNLALSMYFMQNARKKYFRKLQRRSQKVVEQT